MTSQIQQLRERVLGKKDKSKGTALTNVLDMAREFSCLGEVIGRDYEIKDPKGKVIYVIHQKAMPIKTLNVLLKEFSVLKKLDDEKEAAKWGTKGGKIRGRKK